MSESPKWPRLVELEHENKQLQAQLAQVTAERDEWKNAHASLTLEVAEWEDEHTRIYAVLYPSGVGGGVDRHGQPVDPPETDECIRQLKARAEKAEAERNRLIERWPTLNDEEDGDYGVGTVCPISGGWSYLRHKSENSLDWVDDLPTRESAVRAAAGLEDGQ